MSMLSGGGVKDKSLSDGFAFESGVSGRNNLFIEEPRIKL